MNNMNLALTLLIAGFVIVFVVLILLIVIITLYGKIIQGAQKSSRQRKEKKRKNLGVIQRPESEPTPAAVSKPAADTALNDEIPDEIIAVIAAAVDAVYGGKPHKVRAVRRAGNVRSAWGSAGVIHNTRPF